MLIATRGVEFNFNNQMYKQLDGVAMGSTLGKALANIFEDFHESKLFNNTIKPGVYFRYVDDTFVFFGSELECDRFHVNLNQLHPALNFTEEKEPNTSMNFLDVTGEKGVLNFSPAFTENQRLLVARLPAPGAGGPRFLLRAHYKHFCTKITKSLERVGGAAAPLPPSVGVPVLVNISVGIPSPQKHGKSTLGSSHYLWPGWGLKIKWWGN